MRACAVLLLALACCALWPLHAEARVERFAVLVANERGRAEDAPLRYAHEDAERLREVLRDIGGFAPVNTVVLRDESADTVRNTLISVNERIRELVTQPDQQVLLFVYYSGHADAESLHLGDTSLPVRELTQLARGSAATFRMLVLDACRSGAITRVKGGRIVEPFPIVEDPTLPSDGLAFLTASSANEDAQESDELQGSFFTHAFVSGLLGAADGNHDGNVAFEEAYRYAYQATIRATSRSLAGTQHPSFRYDFRGQGELVLTQPHGHARERSNLSFPPGYAVLLMQNDADGAVVAELSADAQARMLSMRPGRYFVRARGQDVMHEGTIDVSAGTSIDVPVREMERIEYARLVRKGARRQGFAQGPELGFRVRTPLSNSRRACIGGSVGYGFDWPSFGARARLSACNGGYERAGFEATSNAYDLELRLHHAWDLAPFSFELGLGAGGSVLTQRFRTRGEAPARTTFAPFVSVGLGGAIDVVYGFYVGLDLAAETHFIPTRDDAEHDDTLRASFGPRASVLAGKRF